MAGPTNAERARRQNMARNLPSDVTDLVHQHRPEVADDLARIHAIGKAQSRPDELPSDKFADDFTWLWDFTYEGQKLTDKEINFVVLYVRNGFQAAWKVFKDATGNNDDGVERWAKPRVLAALHEATKHAVQQWQISTSKVVRELASILDGNIADVCDVGPAGIIVKDFSKLPRHVTGAVQEIHETRNAQGTQIRIKLYDKMPAITLVTKLQGMAPAEKIDITVHGLEDRLSAALQRVPLEIEGELVES